MSDSFKAVCNDFYVNQKLNVKMELPRGRETVLEFFERIRRQYPGMSQFRKYKDELALESEADEPIHRWLAVRAANIRSGVVNPETLSEGYTLHRHVLEIAPFFLNISPLDIDYLELLYGFDLHAGGNQDAIVFDALYGGSPLARVADLANTMVVDCQPLVGIAVGTRGDVEVQFEVKTRAAAQPSRETENPGPISVYLTLRRFGSPKSLDDLPQQLATLAGHGEDLVQSKVIPNLIVPLREAIASGNP